MFIRVQSEPVLPLPFLRHLYGLRQVDLADRIGVDGQTVYRAEKFGTASTTALSVIQRLSIEGDGVDELAGAICQRRAVRIVGLVLEIDEEDNSADGATTSEDESSSHGA